MKEKPSIMRRLLERIARLLRRKPEPNLTILTPIARHRCAVRRTAEAELP
jgi:hypothetical protein